MTVRICDISMKNRHQQFSGIKFRRGIVFSFEEFLHSFGDHDSPQADFSYITGNQKPVGSHSYSRPTIINDLTPPADTIFGQYQDSTRNKIHQIRKNDLCDHRVITSPSDSDLSKLKMDFDRFATVIGIEPLNMNYILALNRANRLNISYVYDKDKVMLAGHVYRMSALRPEMLYSFRAVEPNADKARATFVSKANRYSHYCDMLHFKSAGFETYDFGGVSDDKHTNARWANIDVFKMSFGGTVQVYYNSILYNTIKSKTYLKLKGNPF